MVTTRVFYKGKKELTMAQFEALTSLDDAVDYNITDFPNGGITNAQMTAALGYSRLFEDGEIYVCSDNGTYTKGHTYQVKVTDGVKSWEDITPGGGVTVKTATLQGAAAMRDWLVANKNKPIIGMSLTTSEATGNMMVEYTYVDVSRLNTTDETAKITKTTEQGNILYSNLTILGFQILSIDEYIIEIGTATNAQHPAYSISFSTGLEPEIPTAIFGSSTIGANIDSTEISYQDVIIEDATALIDTCTLTVQYLE